MIQDLPDCWTLISLILGAFGLLLGAVGAAGVIVNWWRRPKVEISEISTPSSGPSVRSGTILSTVRGDIRIGIPAIYGYVAVENRSGFFSESLRSCQADLTLKKDGNTMLRAIGAWEEQGKRSLEKEVDIKKGTQKKLQLFRAIVEPKEKTRYNEFREKEASSFPILNIKSVDLPLYDSNDGKVWIQFPGNVEAIAGGWSAKNIKPDKPGEYELVIELNAENLNEEITMGIDFKEWLKSNSDNWQKMARKNHRQTVQKAKDVVNSI